MWAVFDLLEQAASSDANLLLQGEAGSGKLSLATALHDQTRPGEPFAFCRCDTLGPDQVELGIFDAFDAAGRGTLFLCRVEDLPVPTQPKLAAVLARRQFLLPGKPGTRPLLCRVVAAADRPIADEVRRGKFDEGLLAELAGLRIAVPPLRERREDIPHLARHLIGTVSSRCTGPARPDCDLASAPGLDELPWPGNLPELELYLERAMQAGSALGDTDRTFDPGVSYRDTRADAQAAFERRYVGWLLSRHAGNLSAAAREAAMDRKHLHDLALKHGLRRVRRRRAGR